MKEFKEEEFFRFTKAYLSEAFPNLERLDCPPDSELKSLWLNPDSMGTMALPAITSPYCPLSQSCPALKSTTSLRSLTSQSAIPMLPCLTCVSSGSESGL